MPEYERKGECFDAAASTWVAMATYLIAVELTYDTIWDAILTCARKPAWVNLI